MSLGLRWIAPALASSVLFVGSYMGQAKRLYIDSALNIHLHHTEDDVPLVSHDDRSNAYLDAAPLPLEFKKGLDYENPADLKRYIDNHPLIKRLRSTPGLVETTPYKSVPRELRNRLLTAGPLSGINRVPIHPIYWYDPNKREIIGLVYLGRDLCGHPGIVHGGLLATIIDEGFCRCAFHSLPSRLGLTARLEISYKQPTRANSFVIIRANTVHAKGRKAWVEGSLEALPDHTTDNLDNTTTLVKAKLLAVEPAWASKMNAVLLSG